MSEIEDLPKSPSRLVDNIDVEDQNSDPDQDEWDNENMANTDTNWNNLGLQDKKGKDQAVFFP